MTTLQHGFRDVRVEPLPGGGVVLLLPAQRAAVYLEAGHTRVVTEMHDEPLRRALCDAVVAQLAVLFPPVATLDDPCL